MPKCSKCQHELKDGEKFCDQCGQKCIKLKTNVKTKTETTYLGEIFRSCVLPFVWIVLAFIVYIMIILIFNSF